MTRNELLFWLRKSWVFGVVDSARDLSSLAKAWRQKSFSQHGEDLFLRQHFGDRKGTYIDIGGNHPFRLSNTYLLYRHGWTGLVAEPIQHLIEKHRRFRPKDIQINAAVGGSSGTLTFYEMFPSVLSTCDANEVELAILTHQAKLLREYAVPVVTVAELHRRHLADRRILLLSVDTEGHDLEVLRGVDWEVLHPEIIICEAKDEIATSDVEQFLAGHGYQRVRHLGVNLIFSLR